MRYGAVEVAVLSVCLMGSELTRALIGFGLIFIVVYLIGRGETE